MNTNVEKQDLDAQHIEIKGGDILLSSPLLSDPNFKHSAVLILERDTNGGYLGLVLNRRLDLTLDEICHMPGKLGEMAVCNGGPVDLQRMFWLHILGKKIKDSYEVLPGLYVGGNYDDIISASIGDSLLQGKIKFYLGYSGWTKGQLEREIEAGAWAVLQDPLDPQLLIEESEDALWHTLTKQLGEDYRHWLMMPADPNMN